MVRTGESYPDRHFQRAQERGHLRNFAAYSTGGRPTGVKDVGQALRDSYS